MVGPGAGMGVSRGGLWEELEVGVVAGSGDGEVSDVECGDVGCAESFGYCYY